LSGMQDRYKALRVLDTCEVRSRQSPESQISRPVVGSGQKVAEGGPPHDGIGFAERARAGEQQLQLRQPLYAAKATMAGLSISTENAF
jgi:hypothetical protein